MKRLFIFWVILLPALTQHVHAQYYSVNYDARTVAAMAAAFGTEAVAESYYREQVDDILKHYTAAEVAAQFFMVMVAVVPAPVIQYQRREDDPRHFPADSLLKPVVRIAQGQALHVRRHISAAFRQPVKLPESPLILRAVTLGVGVHGCLGRHKIAAKQIRQESQALRTLKTNSITGHGLVHRSSTVNIFSVPASP